MNSLSLFAKGGLRRLLMMKAAHAGELPPGYERYDYLEKTAVSSRIDTGVDGDDDTLKFSFDVMCLDRNSYSAMFGNYVDESTACWRLIQSAATAKTFMIFSSGNRRAGSSTSIQVIPEEAEDYVNQKVHFDLEYGKGTATFGESYSATTTSETDESPRSTRNIAIFSGSPLATSAIKMRFYNNFKIWSHGKLIRNYVPVVRTSDSKAGLFDLVNRTFNPSITEDDFIAGNDE